MLPVTEPSPLLAFDICMDLNCWSPCSPSNSPGSFHAEAPRTEAEKNQTASHEKTIVLC